MDEIFSHHTEIIEKTGTHTVPWTMYDLKGQRKYLTQHELESFLDASAKRSNAIHSFCWLMTASGCRISEALTLSARNIDFETQCVIVKSLKKRRKTVFRTIPLPPDLLRYLEALIQTRQLPETRLWPWSRMTAYRRICAVMKDAAISGGHASPKGLRHGFGVRAIQAGVPLNMVQRWLGHADMKTTAIYTSVLGPEEREIASRMWRTSVDSEYADSAIATQAPDIRDQIPAMAGTLLDDRRPGIERPTESFMLRADTLLSIL